MSNRVDDGLLCTPRHGSTSEHDRCGPRSPLSSLLAAYMDLPARTFGLVRVF
jgi:hypothetical protein